MASISLSLIAGTIGATITVTGTPASASMRIASMRRCGAAARGSITRAMRRSSVVTEIAAFASPRSAKRASTSISRMMSWLLVISDTGWRQRSMVSRMPRVMP
jgi:hypothetical protein